MSKLEIIKFEKPQCAPCVAVSEMLDKAGVEHQKINYIVGIDAAQSLGVKTVPTVFALTTNENGERVVVHQVRGANPQEIFDFIEKVGYSHLNTISENG